MKTALNKYNAPELLSVLFKALIAAGLDDVVKDLKRMGITRMVDQAWQNREASADRVAQQHLDKVKS